MTRTSFRPKATLFWADGTKNGGEDTLWVKMVKVVSKIYPKKKAYKISSLGTKC